MEKTKKYESTFFASTVLQQAIQRLSDQSSGVRLQYETLSVVVGDEKWNHDNISEFWPDYDRATGFTYFRAQDAQDFRHGLTVIVYKRSMTWDTDVAVKSEVRSEIQDVFNIFDRNHQQSKLPDDPTGITGKIFIGHGRSPLWRELKDHLQDQQKIEAEAYEIGARSGHAVRDILESMLESSSMAFLVMTGEDETADDQVRARQNVVHELGLFQGRLGFVKAIAVVEEGTELFSNIEGIQQLRFSKGNIREIFGDIVATIKRESA